MRRTAYIFIIVGLALILLGIITKEYIDTKCNNINKNDDFWVRNCDYK